MESTIRQTSDVKHELDVVLTQAELAPYYDAVYRDAQKKVNLKGFRQGKVPLNMIKRLYGASLEQDAVEQAVQKEFAKYAEEQNLQPIGMPAITRLDKTEEEGISFTVAYEVMPQFELGEYKSLSARKIYHVVSDDEIEAQLEQARESQAVMEDAEAVTDENHSVKLDLVRLDDGQPQEEGAMRDIQVYLRRADVNPELKSSLLNTKVGDTFTIDLPTGENEAMNTYLVTVKEIQAVALPEVNDELAGKLLGEGTTAEDLREYVRQGISGEYDQRYSGIFRDELINALLERHDFMVPDVLVAEVLRSFIEDMKKGPDKELPKDFDQDKFIQDTRPLAERTARWALLRDRIIAKEELSADDADYEGLADIEAQRSGIEYETLLGYFKRSDQVRERILAEKALQLLEDYAIVNEVEDKELAAQQPAAEVPAENAEQEAEETASQEG